MPRSITLDARQRQALLDRYRKDSDPEVRFRAHFLLLLDDGHTWTTVCALLFCSSRTIDRWVKRFAAEGEEGLAGHKPGRPFRLASAWTSTAVEWVTTKVPRDFGFLRSRWCCEAVALLMFTLNGIKSESNHDNRGTAGHDKRWNVPVASGASSTGGLFSAPLFCGYDAFAQFDGTMTDESHQQRRSQGTSRPRRWHRSTAA